MKIKSLWISKYKNIENLTVNFKANSLISLLVGQNGLGKSNLIEVLALIFRDLDLLDNQDDFENWAYELNHFEYDIHYLCKNHEVRIECKESTFKVWIKKLSSINELQELPFSDFKKLKSENLLPKYIIGYYSGENKRIKEIIEPFEKKVWDDLKGNKGLDKNFRRLFFADNHHAQMVLLTLLLYRGQDKSKKFQERIKELIENYTSFEKLYEFDLKLQQPKWYKLGDSVHKKHGVLQLEENLIGKQKAQYPFWGAKGKANKILRFFYDYSFSPPTYGVTDAEDSKTEKEFLEFNSINKEDAALKIYEEFGHPISFFDAFETLSLIDVISSINLKVESKIEGISYDFTELSEGERQLITVLGLILITGQDDCLFLLDEPDTHLNPRWQREYVRLLEQFNLNDDNSHIIVATHSPLIVQAAENADIFLYKKYESGKIEVVSDDLKIHNWRIDQVLASEYFDFDSTRPPEIDDLMKKRLEIIRKGNLNEEDKKLLKSYENEIGYLPTGETIDELEAMAFIKQTADSLKNDKNR
ncbi:AAA family ATPase [Pontibacter pamirensis]|uniref:AAA family ATPase n=1 Tax=Pontibacter pamirensis TaxID=2562824 RepID=UPI001389CD2F|nr:AAA family ATPase [Pontibacter pamirensis]